MLLNKKALSLLVLLSSCSSVDYSLQTGYISVFQDIKTGIVGSRFNEITNDDVNFTKFSFIQLRIGRGPSTKMVLRDVDGSIHKWIDETGAYIKTHHGIIIETEGLPNDIAIRDIGNLFDRQTSSTYISFSHPEANMLPMQLKLIDEKQTLFTKLGFKQPEELKLTRLGMQEPVKLKSVHATIDIIGWHSTMKLYFNEAGLILRSEQKTSPGSKLISINFYYKF